MTLIPGLGDRLLNILPHACVLCGANAGTTALCTGCLSALPRLGGHRCTVCAAPTPGPATCGRCISRAPAYDRVVAGLDYESPADFLVGELKYARNVSAARALAIPLGKRLESESNPDIVLPMPIAASRLRERGFNQASEIARHVCRAHRLGLDERLASRGSARQSQTSLPWRDRAKNVRGVFRCHSDLEGKSIAVVDDVLTTGATLNELATVLKRAGAREVVGWVATRTPSRANGS